MESIILKGKISSQSLIVYVKIDHIDWLKMHLAQICSPCSKQVFFKGILRYKFEAWNIVKKQVIRQILLNSSNFFA